MTARRVSILAVFAALGVVAALAARSPTRVVGGDSIASSASGVEGLSHPGPAPVAADHAGNARPGAPTSTNLIRLRSSPTVQRDSTALDYDVVQLASIGISSRELFEKEARNDAWAVPREARLQSQVACDLGLKFEAANVESVTCRTSACEVVVLVPAEVHTEVFSFVQRLALADTIAPSIDDAAEDGESRRLRFILLFTPDQRDPTAYEDWYKGVRSNMTAALRAAGRPAPSDECVGL